MPFKNMEGMDQIPSESEYKSYVQEGLQNRRIVYRNIMLLNDLNEDRILTERAPISLDSQENVYFRDLTIYLKEQNLIPSGCSLCFFDVERGIYVHQGREPVSAATMIPLKKLGREDIKIKYRPLDHMFPKNLSYNYQEQSSFAQNSAFRDLCFGNKSSRFGLSSESQFESVGQNVEMRQQQNKNLGNECSMMGNDEEEINLRAIPREKRVKERKIGYVYDRVMEWRRYYEQGVENEQGRLQKVNLDVAASLVGLSRKSLDDYYKYIRKAESFKFDFKSLSEEKIGVLRNFVRDRQKRTLCCKEEEEYVIQDEDNKETASSQGNNGITENNLNNNHPDSNDEQENTIKLRNLPLPPPYKNEINWSISNNFQAADAFAAGQEGMELEGNNYFSYIPFEDNQQEINPYFIRQMSFNDNNLSPPRLENYDSFMYGAQPQGMDNDYNFLNHDTEDRIYYQDDC